LAVLDLSEKAAQPMTAFGFTLVYNGEIYNYIELRGELERQGFDFTTQSDTEVILAAYRFWGEACVQKFNGMWAFVLYDPSRFCLFASRDRFGEKPLYYAQIGDYFALASEIKQFTTLPQWRAELNTETATTFFRTGKHDYSRETFFNGVFQLRGGENMVYHLKTHQFQIAPYYVLADKIQNRNQPVKPTAAQDSFLALLTDAVRIRMRSDVAVGTSLSGGLDSGSIAVLMADYLAKRQVSSLQKSITATYPNHVFDEARYAKAIGEKAKLSQYFIQPNAESFLSDMNRLVWHQDEPLSTDSAFAQYSVFREARKQNLTVMLDGQGGDEILAGYASFYKPFFYKLLKTNLVQAFTEMAFYLKQNGAADLTAYLKRKMTPQYADYFLGFGDRAEVSDTFAEANPSHTPLQNLSHALITRDFLPMLLHFADRNAMAFSVESRLPFLDYRLVEFCLNLPDAYKIYRGDRKSILRQTMRPFLPEQVWQRRDKIGFFNPGEEWMQADPKTWYAQMLPIVQKWQGVFSPNVLSEFDKFLHRKPISISESAFWKILFFGKWAEVFKIEPV
jgi:asparagine synthase (glutamine-hydrolysing)